MPSYPGKKTASHLYHTYYFEGKKAYAIYLGSSKRKRASERDRERERNATLFKTSLSWIINLRKKERKKKIGGKFRFDSNVFDDISQYPMLHPISQ